MIYFLHRGYNCKTMKILKSIQILYFTFLSIASLPAKKQTTETNLKTFLHEKNLLWNDKFEEELKDRYDLNWTQNTHRHKHKYVHIFTHTHTYIHLHIHTYMNIHTYIHTPLDIITHITTRANIITHVYLGDVRSYKMGKMSVFVLEENIVDYV